MDYRSQIDDLLARAEALGHGPTRASLTEQAVQLADRHQDVEAGLQTRQEYVTATMFAGQPEKMLVAFSWILTQVDRDAKADIDLSHVLWQYKWVVNTLPDFPQISRAQIEEMFEDIERRFEEVGASMQAVWLKRRAVAMRMGDLEAAEEAHEALRRFRRDDLSDCEACEMDAAVEYAIFQGKDQRAIEKAGPILRGRFTCGEVPQITYAQILIPLLRLDRGDDAMAWHVKGYRMISKNPAEFIPQIADHIRFLTLTGNYARALRLVERHLALALDTNCLAWQFDFWLALKLLLETLISKRKTSLKLRLAESFPAVAENGEYQTADLISWFDMWLTDLAGQFDARNGNQYFTQRIDSTMALQRWAQAIPFPERDS